MSASNVNSAVGPRQVACETYDNDQIPVALDILSVSGTFKNMCDELSLEKHDVFPADFPVKNVNTRTFKKVIDWCKEHKDDPEPIIEKDPLTRECKWFEFTDSDKSFFNVPMPELLELIMAANYLDIPRLYHYACQPVAARIKGDAPPEKQCSEPRQMVLTNFMRGNTLLGALKTAFSASNSPKPYVVLIVRSFHRGTMNEVIANKKTLELLTIRTRRFDEVVVERE
ncbi:S-phase kinase-associated protein 1A [Aphelenchoides avenae]|nr:S-phase kinase-associated protein 1A [Aphelenchus avenae]KAH7704845.1 S-phase kinase-associated protein 1A [Aphelenchus avenae]